MLSSHQQYWLRVWQTARCHAEREPLNTGVQALAMALTPDDNGEIPLNNRHFPADTLYSLRAMARGLKKLGHVNTEGNEFHPDWLRVEIIPEGFATVFQVMTGTTLSDEQRCVLKQAYLDGTRQKDHYEHLTDEQHGRLLWRANRKLRKRTKKTPPWDQDQNAA